MQIRVNRYKIADAITSLERQSLRDKMAHWEMNSMKKRLTSDLEEGINKWSGIFLGHYLFNKLNQEVM
jgi:hypothetical protein